MVWKKIRKKSTRAIIKKEEYCKKLGTGGSRLGNRGGGRPPKESRKGADTKNNQNESSLFRVNYGFDYQWIQKKKKKRDR